MSITSLIARLLACILPLAVIVIIKGDHRSGSNWAGFAFFTLLAAGYMFLETTLVQKLNLVLGGPLYSLTLVTGCLLVFAGLGSKVGEKFGERASKWSLVLPPVMFVLYFPLAAKLLESCIAALGTQLWLRLSMTALVLAPLCFVLGFPFPWGLKKIKASSNTPSVALMYAVNALFCVAAIMSGLYLSARYGLGLLYNISAVCYFAVFVIAFLFPAGRNSA